MVSYCNMLLVFTFVSANFLFNQIRWKLEICLAQINKKIAYFTTTLSDTSGKRKASHSNVAKLNLTDMEYKDL